MSFLSEELNRQISHINASVDGIADKSGISRGQIYKWLKADQISISAAQIDALSTALSNDPIDHAKLLVAHLQDEKFGNAASLVRIELDTLAEFNDRPKPRTKGEKAIAYLASARIQHKSVNDLVIDLAHVLGAEL